MKKILFILSRLIPAGLLADGVSPEQARRIAENFMSNSRPAALRAAGTQVSLRWDGRQPGTRAAQDQAAFYVFENASGGFVIVAGEDSVEPILGYSDSGRFVTDDMPAGVAAWFDYIRGGVEHMRARRAAAPAEVRTAWSRAVSGATAPTGGGVLLETANWDQTGPYNLLCSQYIGYPVYTGCVATAAAIVMRYHRWPERSHGSLNDYSFGRKYDWDNMLLNYYSFYYPEDEIYSTDTQEQRNAVAQLMLDCGIMSKMSYGSYYTDGSSAVTSDAILGLTEYMYYDKGIEILERDSHSRADFLSRLKNNINTCGPAIISGTTAAISGHAFVIDGYDASDRIHINWGWGGSNNGYYAVPDFGDYTVNQVIFLGIRPDRGTAARPKAKISISNIGGTKGLVLTEVSVGMSDSGVRTLGIACRVDARFNNGVETLTDCSISFALIGRDGRIKSESHVMNIDVWDPLPPGYYHYNKYAYVSAPISDYEDGDEVMLTARYDGSDEWEPVTTSTDWDDITGRIVVNKAELLGKMLAFKFDRTTRVLSSNNFDSEVIGITIFDSNGRMVNTADGIIDAGSGNYGLKYININTSNLAKGAYTFRFGIDGFATKDIRFVF